MKIRVAFVADVTIHGGKIPKEELVVAFVDWLYEQDVPFTDSIAEYMPDEYPFDAIELVIDSVSVR